MQCLCISETLMVQAQLIVWSIPNMLTCSSAFNCQQMNSVDLSLLKTWHINLGFLSWSYPAGQHITDLKRSYGIDMWVYILSSVVDIKIVFFSLNFYVCDCRKPALPYWMNTCNYSSVFWSSCNLHIDFFFFFTNVYKCCLAL